MRTAGPLLTNISYLGLPAGSEREPVPKSHCAVVNSKLQHVERVLKLIQTDEVRAYTVQFINIVIVDSRFYSNRPRLVVCSLNIYRILYIHICIYIYINRIVYFLLLIWFMTASLTHSICLQKYIEEYLERIIILSL